jgi:hypothetical protein
MPKTPPARSTAGGVTLKNDYTAGGTLEILMEILEIPKDRIYEIEPLWRELNSHYHERSSNFKEHFSSFTFA